ncbi:MAG: hypothetical protein AAFZ87_00170 [Planctomycetota bacterium]
MSTPSTNDGRGTETEVIAQGGFKSLEAQRKRLGEHGIRAEVVCPPGANPNA